MINLRNLAYTSAHFVFLYSLYALLYAIGWITVSPLSTNLILCDTYWYNEMRLHGYYLVESAMCNLAYFPLFPMVWKLLMIDSVQMSILNLIIFLIGLNLLLGKEKSPPFYLLAVVSLPSFIFFALPYSESLFFLFGCILLMGYERNSDLLICLGLLGCGLTRSVAVFFIPALILTEFLQQPGWPDIATMKKIAFRSLLYSSMCLLSLIVVLFMQFTQTGKWFYFLQIQKYWGRRWQVPSLPFTTEAPARVIGVDVIGLIVGVIAIYLLFGYAWKKLKLRTTTDTPIRRAFLFSLLYLSAICLLDALFTDNDGERTKLWSMNRHIICTPFLICFINWFTFKVKLDVDKTYGLSMILVSGIIISALYEYTFHLIYYLVFFATFVFIQAFRRWLSPYLSVAYLPIYVLNVFLWLAFYQAFLHDQWVG